MSFPDIRKKDKDKIDVFYINEDISRINTSKIDDISLIKIKAEKPNDDILYVYSNELNNLINFNIKEFSYVIFEEDINRLDDSEFEYFWIKIFEPWFTKINDEYLDIDIEDFKFQINSTLEKKYLVKKLIHFIMYIIPYLLLKKIFKERGIEKIDEAEHFLVDNFENQPYYLKEQYVNKIEEIINYSNNFLKTISDVIKHSKKNTLEDMTGLLEDQIGRQNDYYDIFKTIINNTVNEKLFKLTDLLIHKDFNNIAF